MQKLKLESEKLKAENRALTRVVSKLSGATSSTSHNNPYNTKASVSATAATLNNNISSS